MIRTRGATTFVLANALLAAAALAALAPRPAAGELVLAFAVTRHGARNVLPKNATLGEDESSGGPTLLPQGQANCAAAGAAFRARYLAHPSCERTFTCLSQPGAERYGILGVPANGFNNYNTHAQSSSLDRTLLSAEAFLSGAFPPVASGLVAAPAEPGPQAQRVPVYSAADLDDWRIRAYTKCTSYQARLEDWFASDEFKAKEEETRAVRDAVAAAAPGLDTSLENWWNVFDAFNVWRKYQVGEPMPAISDALMANVTAIANWLETAKMRSRLTENGLGGPLLASLLGYLQAAAARVADGSRSHYYKLALTSAHYNTQLGLLAALGMDTQNLTTTQLPWLSVIPATSSVMVFELHADGKELLAVKLVIQDGPKKNYTAVPLPMCAQAGDAAEGLAGPGACELGAFVRYANASALRTVGEWCAACKNTEMDGCLAAAVREDGGVGALQVGRSGGGNGAGGGGGGEGWKIAVAVIASAGGAAALTAAAMLLAGRRRRGAGWSEFLNGPKPAAGLSAPAV